MIATIKPRDVGKTRRRLAVELIVELEGIDKKIKTVKQELRDLIVARESPPDHQNAAHHGRRPAAQSHRRAIYFDAKKAAGKTSMEAMRAKTTTRSGWNLFLSEIVATAGLVALVSP
jgi:hypothetical protein